MDAGTRPTAPQPPRRRGRLAWLSRWWDRGPVQKLALLAFIPVFLASACCSGSFIFAATPYGRQLTRETEATETVQAAAHEQATAVAHAHALAHPKPTATATRTPMSTSTPARADANRDSNRDSNRAAQCDCHAQSYAHGTA